MLGEGPVGPGGETLGDDRGRALGGQERALLDALAHDDRAVEADRRDVEGVDLGVHRDGDHARIGRDDGGGATDAALRVGGAFDDEARSLQFAHEVGDRRPVQARTLGERGARARARPGAPCAARATGWRGACRRRGCLGDHPTTVPRVGRPRRCIRRFSLRRDRAPRPDPRPRAPTPAQLGESTIPTPGKAGGARIGSWTSPASPSPPSRGEETTFGELTAGKAALVVNVASRCGLAPQYEALEALHKKYADRGFTVIGFPSNQFLQELSDEDKIAEYCSATWGVTFPMSERSRSTGAAPTRSTRSSRTTPDAEARPSHLVELREVRRGPDGKVTRFSPRTLPDAPEVVAAIETPTRADARRRALFRRVSRTRRRARVRCGVSWTLAGVIGG